MMSWPWCGGSTTNQSVDGFVQRLLAAIPGAVH